MATTALFAEVLVVGLLALPWFTLTVLSLTRANLQTLPDVHGWDGLVLAVGLAFAYALGIVVDRLGDWAFERWDERLSQAIRRTESESATLPDRTELRFRLMGRAPSTVLDFLDYARSRRRILRGVVVNSVLTLVTAFGAIAFSRINGTLAAPAAVLVILIAISAGLSVTAAFGWWHIGLMYYRRSLLAYRLFAARE